MSKSTSSNSSILGIFINILIPVLILDYCSAEPDGQFWHIGPLWALVVALSLPLVYGLRSLAVSKKFDIMSGLGFVGVLLTGVISLFVIGEGGRIHAATPWLFAGKEALIPLILAAAVLLSRATDTPLLNMFIYTPELFDVKRIETAIAQQGRTAEYAALQNSSSWILAGTLCASAVGNFFLSMAFMAPVMKKDAAQQQVAYNEAISDITWWGFLIIGVPLLIAFIYIMARLVKNLGILAGLSREQILLAR